VVSVGCVSQVAATLVSKPAEMDSSKGTGMQLPVQLASSLPLYAMGGCHCQTCNIILLGMRCTAIDSFVLQRMTQARALAAHVCSETSSV